MESWGGNVNGQLGVGNKINYDEPQELAELEETIGKELGGRVFGSYTYQTKGFK